MKWQYIVLVALAAAIGGVAGSFATQHAQNSTTAFAAEGDDQTRIIAAVDKDLPSVVALDVIANGTELVPENPLALLLGRPGAERIRRFHERASGSGFVYDGKGLILTDDHVVHGAQKITAVFANGDKIPATIYGEDPTADIALVKVTYPKLPQPLVLGDSSQVKRGEWTIAIGEPLQLQQTVTVGVLSAFGRNETITTDTGEQRQFRNLLQTSAPINPGNSGGPLINDDGVVIAINQSVAQPAQGIGFAVPSNSIKNSIALIEKHPGVNRVESGFLGVELVPLTNEVRRTLHYKGAGAVVAGIIAGSPAASSGLQTGDVLQSIDGRKITGSPQAVRIVAALPPGKVAQLGVWRKGRVVRVSVRLIARPLE